MGDEADYLTQCCLDIWDSGAYDGEDAGLYRRRRRSPQTYLPIQKTCKYCGETGLHWQSLNGKWKLYSSEGKIHDCSITPETIKLKEIDDYGKLKRFCENMFNDLAKDLNPKSKVYKTLLEYKSDYDYITRKK